MDPMLAPAKTTDNPNSIVVHTAAEPSLSDSIRPVSPRGDLSPELVALLQSAELAHFGPALLGKLGLRSPADVLLLLQHRGQARLLQLLESAAVGMSVVEASRLLQVIQASAAAQLQSHTVRALVVGCNEYAILESLDNPANGG